MIKIKNYNWNGKVFDEVILVKNLATIERDSDVNVSFLVFLSDTEIENPDKRIDKVCLTFPFPEDKKNFIDSVNRGNKNIWNLAYEYLKMPVRTETLERDTGEIVDGEPVKEKITNKFYTNNKEIDFADTEKILDYIL